MVPDINLIPREERTQQSSKLLNLLLAILVLLILSLLVWQYFSARADVTRLGNEEANLIAQRDQLSANVNSLQPENQGSMQQSLQFVETVSYPVTQLIYEIQGLQPSNSHLRSYTFSPESVTVLLDFETLSDAATYVSRLSNSAYFTDGQVNSVTNSDLGGELESENEIDFDVVPRQSVEITLLLDRAYLTAGGVQ
ncbi:malate synthase [Lysinibacillus yapensis]|uniref:Malate synthase n=1 Tax=Ureibacillus yapensis TaxID=2304605 RepID=A0A396SDW7_9BACL|nr:malate synthase [Lysinibacillus yapensis]RHW39485.1 malate synthase [Lysinibacillus yapensis]